MFPRVMWTVNESSYKAVKRIWSVVYLPETCYFPENSGTLLFRSVQQTCFPGLILLLLILEHKHDIGCNEKDGARLFLSFRFIRSLNSSVYPGTNPAVPFQEGFQCLPNGHRLYKTTWPNTMETGNFWRLRGWETSFSKVGKESQVIDFASFCHHQAAKFSPIGYKYQAI